MVAIVVQCNPAHFTGLHMQFLTRCVLSAAALTVSASAFAALPEPGLWAIDSEVNGKPGRGIQIDRQGGETVIASYFGYRADGAAVFYQAVGKITDGKTFNADLIEYKGGTAIGGAVKDASEATTIGKIQITLDSDTSGSVTLPGEKSAAFSRYVYEDLQQRLNNLFLVSNFNGSTHSAPEGMASLSIEALGNQLKIRISMLGKEHEGYRLYSGDLVRKGSGFYSIGHVEDFPANAGPPASKVAMTFENLTVNDVGVLSTNFTQSDASGSWKGEGTLLGKCYAMPSDAVISTPPEPCLAQHLGLTQR